MSEAYLAALAESNSALKKQVVLKSNGLLKTNHIAKQSCESIGQKSQSMETSRQSTLGTLKKLIFSQADSHAKILARREREKAWLEKEVAYGGNLSVLLAKYDRASHSLRTFQTSLTKGCTLCLQTLPKSGMMRNGFVYALPILEPCTSEKESLLLPTPIASDATTANIWNQKIRNSLIMTRSGIIRRQIGGGANERDWLDKTSPIFIANAFRERIQRFSKKTLSGKSGLSWCKDIRSIENLRERTDLPEPLLCRNTNGISERLHAIGNAVVPQVAEFFAEIVKEKIK
jgi:hypothetical protein